MVNLLLPIKFLLALVLGAVIGLERGAHEEEEGHRKGIHGSFGVRTFALITFLGAIAGFLRAEYFSLFLTINVAFMILLVAYYVLGSVFSRDYGATTELAVIFAYLIGLFVTLGLFPTQLILAMTVVLLLILSWKQKLKGLVAGIRRSEINAFISYAIIALVILPFLPNKAFFLSDIPTLGMILSSYGIELGKLAQIEIINPFKLWLVVALITGVDMAGYILERTLGQRKGWLLTSFTGGFVSSTATTQTLAQQSKQSKIINLLIAAALFANLSSFFQVFILIAPINGQFLAKATPFFIAIVLAAALGGLFFLKFKRGPEEELAKTKARLKESEIFHIGPALKFAVIFMAIRIVTKVALAYFGNSGFLLTSAIGAVAGLDAVTINIAEMAGGKITFLTGVLALILVNAVNLAGKSVYSFAQGDRRFALKMTAGLAVIVAASFFGLAPFY